MDLSLFTADSPGELLRITGSDAVTGSWEHRAFLVSELPSSEPSLSGETYRHIAAAGRQVSSLNAVASRLPDPTLLRRPSLRQEAQATSQLEGTTVPLSDVLMADAEHPTSHELQEILNYETMAEHAFAWVSDGRPLTVGLLEDLQGDLMRHTRLEHESGHLREGQVIIGRRPEVPARLPRAHQARFIPAPPGDQLRARLQQLVEWMNVSHDGEIDPIVVAGMSHYQFEALHPFRDGNGRLGRLLIILCLMQQGQLNEPSLTVSPWFERNRQPYYDALLGVSTRGDWDGYINFFARGIEASASSTLRSMLDLLEVQQLLHARWAQSSLRAQSGPQLIDYAVSHPSFSRRDVEQDLGVSYARARTLIAQLVELGILAEYIRPDGSASGRFYAPMARDVLLS